MNKYPLMMSKHQELRKRIIETSLLLFKSNGIKAIKMDDIASSLSISKRTLYEVFQTKEILVFECIKHDTEEKDKMYAEFACKANNEMEILVYFLKVRLDEIKSISPRFFSDLYKFPTVVEYIRKSKEKRTRGSVEFLHRGVENGYFVSDINYEITNFFCDSIMASVMENKLYNYYTLHEIFRNFILFTLRAYCTDKGLKVIKTLIT